MKLLLSSFVLHIFSYLYSILIRTKQIDINKIYEEFCNLDNFGKIFRNNKLFIEYAPMPVSYDIKIVRDLYCVFMAINTRLLFHIGLTVLDIDIFVMKPDVSHTLYKSNVRTHIWKTNIYFNKGLYQYHRENIERFILL